MLAKVYHARSPNFGYARNDDTDPVWPKDFEHVANVELTGKEDNEALEYVFERTNTTHCSWFEKDNVTVVTKSRSTSVGDVVELPVGKYFMCCNTGWEKIKS